MELNNLTTLYSEAEKDSDLYSEFLNGDNEAFNLIVKRYRKQVISFIFKYCKNYEIKVFALFFL